jgi:hypothetical protein
MTCGNTSCVIKVSPWIHLLTSQKSKFYVNFLVPSTLLKIRMFLHQGWVVMQSWEWCGGGAKKDNIYKFWSLLYNNSFDGSSMTSNLKSTKLFSFLVLNCFMGDMLTCHTYKLMSIDVDLLSIYMHMTCLHGHGCTSRKHGKKERQTFVHCGSFDHLDLQSLNDCKFFFFVLRLSF